MKAEIRGRQNRACPKMQKFKSSLVNAQLLFFSNCTLKNKNSANSQPKYDHTNVKHAA